MRQLVLLCIVCQDPVADGDYCTSCKAEYATEIEHEPLPPWLIEARQTEHDRRRSERREAAHADDPTQAELDARIGSDASNIDEFLERQASAVKTDLPAGTLEDYLSASQFLNELTPEQRQQFTVAERVAVMTDLMFTYKDEHGDERGPLERQPAYEDKVRAYNSFMLAYGGLKRPIGTSRFRKILKRARLKLQQMRKR